MLSGDTVGIFEQAGDVKENIEAKQFTPVLQFADKKQEGLDFEYTLASDVGVDEYIDQWRGLFAPAETPPEQLDALSAACEKASQDPKYEEFRANTLEQKGAFMDRQEFTKFVEDEQTKLKTLGEKYGVFK